MLDLAWCGGLSEARKIASMAEAWHLPVAPHDCTGPVVFTASCHLSLHARNALIQESVRAFYTGWYNELVTALPTVANGEVTISDAPGSVSSLPQGSSAAPTPSSGSRTIVSYDQNRADAARSLVTSVASMPSGSSLKTQPASPKSSAT